MRRTGRGWRAAYAGVAALDTALAVRGGPAARWRRVTKPLLMPLLAASAVRDDGNGRAPVSTVAALGFGWGGDVALLGRGTSAFVTGAGLFGAGHGGHVRTLARLRRRPARPTPASLAALGCALALGPAMGYAAARRDRVLALPVAGYSALLALTLAAAGQLDPGLPAYVRRRAVAGAALFTVSDALIGVRTFVVPDAPATQGDRARHRALDRVLDGAVMATYTSAQYLLVEAARPA